VFSVREDRGGEEEVFVVPCEDGVAAYRNYCTHETDQRLARDGIGAMVRDGEVICPRHGSTFDACSGECDNGKARGTTLAEVAVTVEDGQVILVDDSVTYLYEGSLRDDEGDDGGPSSSSHLQF